MLKKITLFALRKRLSRYHRMPEAQIVDELRTEFDASGATALRIKASATKLATQIRNNQSLMDALLAEYSLSNLEGQLLMGLAEALQRVNDKPTMDRLIGDKLLAGDWLAHFGRSRSSIINVMTLALIVGRVLASISDHQVGDAIPGVFKRVAAFIIRPVLRLGTQVSIKLMAGHYVMGQSIDAALARSAKQPRYWYTFDMLGEGARTLDDAARFFQAYYDAIERLGRNGNQTNIHVAPGISVKLSALHPRYEYAKRHEVVPFLVERLKVLALLSHSHGLSLIVDAEEANRLEMSLDIVAAIALDDDLKDWNGFGLAVQAYQKRAPAVVDWLEKLAELAGKTILVRLVKGAYWDSEIKWSQIEGFDDYPVFTEKSATDLCYQVCAQKLLKARRYLYPQFATHNAYTVAAILTLDDAMPVQRRSGYEFQRLHGMGDTLYKTLISETDLPCRVYCPVGEHEDLLAYLVRRLLENGANSSFVNQIGDTDVDLELVLSAPLDVLKTYETDKLPLPKDIYANEGLGRKNAAAVDLEADDTFLPLQTVMSEAWRSCIEAASELKQDGLQVVINPADNTQVLSYLHYDTAGEIEEKLVNAAEFLPSWQAVAVAERAALACLLADLMEAQLPELMAICCQEAGKTIDDALAEVREAVDFCRYYGGQAVSLNGAEGEGRAEGLGVVLCISPWNFPLAIFVGQVIAALVAGNTVLAKPAEQTSLIALKIRSLMLACGFPNAAMQLVLGLGKQVGEQLVPDTRVQGVMFTGSTPVAVWISETLNKRADAPVTFVAETGGQNAMIVDGTALPEQVVDDVMASGFHSAGQRCSALRILLIQDDISDRVIPMIQGAMESLSLGDPADLSTDIGPIIDEVALVRLNNHIDQIDGVERQGDSEQLMKSVVTSGNFFAPRLIEIQNLSALKQEVFGPVVHFMRFKSDQLEALVDDINQLGFGLTFGVHSRNNRLLAFLTKVLKVGNVYVNRAITGAVVGVQPFGGRGLSGTGPKAGGPDYVPNLMRCMHSPEKTSAVWIVPKQLPFDGLKHFVEQALVTQRTWSKFNALQRLACVRAMVLNMEQTGMPFSDALLMRLHALFQIAGCYHDEHLLPGPAGEKNTLVYEARGLVAMVTCPDVTQDDLVVCVVSNLLAANAMLVTASGNEYQFLSQLRMKLGIYGPLLQIFESDAIQAVFQQRIDAMIVPQAQVGRNVAVTLPWLAGNTAGIVKVITLESDKKLFSQMYLEKAISVNTAAAGGDVALMTR